MPCFSSNPDSALKESIRVSNAESQLAVPLSMTTVFGVNVISSPKGSAVCTGAAAAGGVAGVSAVAGGGTGAGEGLATGAGVVAGAGVADGAGGAGAGVAGAAVVGGVAGGGDCASTLPMPIAPIGTSAIRARRKQRGKF